MKPKIHHVSQTVQPYIKKGAIEQLTTIRFASR